MNKYLKRFLALGIVGASVLTFSACATNDTPGKHEQTDGPGYVDPTPDGQTPIDPVPVDPIPDDEKPVDPTPEEPVVDLDKEFNEFLAKMNAEGDYTYTLSDDNFYLIDGTSVKACLDGNRNGDFYMYEDGVPYVYRFEGSKGLWHKENFEQFDADSLVLEKLNDAIVIDYDSKTETYSIQMDGKVYDATFDGEALTMTLESGEEFSISKVGETNVELPKAMFIVDDTEKEEEKPPVVEPDEPDEPVVEEEKVYTLDEQGNRVYNSKVLAEVFLTALNSTKEGETQNVYASITYGYGAKVNDIKFVNSNGGKLQIGATAVSIYDANNFAIFDIDEDAFASIENDKDAWISAVNSKNISVNNSNIMQYTTDDAQYGEIVATAFENVANKLAENGVQNESINTLGTPITKLKNADVVWAYSIENSRTGSGYDIGNVARCGLAGVVLNAEGNYEYFETAVVSRWSASKGPLERVAENGVFIVTDLENNIEANNDFYKTKSTKSIDLYNEKEGKELEM